MIPIKPIFNFPLKVHNKLHAVSQDKDGFLKKIIKLSYNVTALPVVVIAASTVCVVGLILALVTNAVTAPFVTLYKNFVIKKPESDTLSYTEPLKKTGFFSWLLDNPPSSPGEEEYYPQLKDFEGPVEEKGSAEKDAQTNPMPFLDFSNIDIPKEVKDRTLPCTFFRRATRQAPPPKIATTWPPPCAQGTNSLSLDFLQEKTTIPETQTTFWGLVQLAGSPEGYKYLDKKGAEILPVLFPNRMPSPLNRQAPILSREMVSSIQTDPTIASKYLLALSVVLQYWGLKISPIDKSIILADDFDARAAAIRENPHREEMFQQVLTSVGECGFGNLSMYLALILNKHKEEYNISPNTVYKPLSSLRSLETLLERNAQKILKAHQGPAFTTAQKEQIWWETYLNLFPSVQETGDSKNVRSQKNAPPKIPTTALSGASPPLGAEKNIPAYWVRVSNFLTFFFSLDETLEKNIHTTLGTCEFFDPLIAPSTDPEDTRPILKKLDAPRYFFSYEMEKEVIQISQTQRQLKRETP